jgi:uncharacterized protein YfcZ (UPF0381/DUF406 family)
MNDNISKALDISFTSDVPTKKEEKDIKNEKNLDTDFEYAKDNIKLLIANGSEAIEEILKVAKAGDSPRAYEVVSQLLKTVADMNKDLLELHQRAKAVKKETVNVKNTTNNSIYVGSTSELQDLINKDRSRSKALDSQTFLDNTNGL